MVAINRKRIRGLPRRTHVNEQEGLSSVTGAAWNIIFEGVEQYYVHYNFQTNTPSKRRRAAITADSCDLVVRRVHPAFK
jgi:hypothetical protein